MRALLWEGARVFLTREAFFRRGSYRVAVEIKAAAESCPCEMR